MIDAGNIEDSVFIPAYDQKIPQLHTKKKKELGLRTARWALKNVYGKESIVWDTAELLAVESEDGKIVLTFDKPVLPDDFGSEIEGFSIADQSGAFYMAGADAVAMPSKDRADRNKKIEISSPLVEAPVAVRDAWARAPMGNLKVNGIPWQPLPSFRTDHIKFSAEVAHQDPDGQKKNSEAIKVLRAQAAAALKTRTESTTPRP